MNNSPEFAEKKRKCGLQGPVIKLINTVKNENSPASGLSKKVNRAVEEKGLLPRTNQPVRKNFKSSRKHKERLFICFHQAGDRWVVAD